MSYVCVFVCEGGLGHVSVHVDTRVRARICACMHASVFMFV